MTLALYTCIVSPHQIPLARAIMRLHPEVSFYYVYTQELPADATKRGWEWHEECDWLVSMEKNPEQALQILESADVVLSGERDVDFFERRSRAGKKTLYMFERWFKPIPLRGIRGLERLVGLGDVRLPGWVRMVVPGYWKMAWRVVKLANCDPNFKCLAIGPWAAKDMRLIGVHPDKILPWAYFVEPSQHPNKYVHSTPTSYTSQRPLRILWVGRMLQWKRVDTLIKAVKRLDSARFELLLVGHGPCEAGLKKLTNGAVNITFSSGVPIAEVRRFMREYDAYVLPSNEEEGWGAALNEALEEGMIVFGTFEAGSSATMLPDDRKYHAGDEVALSGLLKEAADGELLPDGIGDWSVSGGVEKLMVLCNE